MLERTRQGKKQELDEEGTQAFTNALNLALKGLTADKEGNLILENGVLKLDVEVTLHKDSHLYWYYQPEPNLITPMRMLNQGGLDKRATIGMKDGKIL